MKRKTIVLVALLALAGAAGVFASGDKELPSQPGVPAPGAPGTGPQGTFGPRGTYGPRGMYGPRATPPGSRQAPTFSQEKVSVTGKLYFENLRHPELKSGGKNYELMVPWFYLDQVDLKDGATVSVEGYTVTGVPYDDVEDKDDVFLHVTKAVIDGKEYDLEGYGPRGGFRGRGPMMGPGGRGDWDGRAPWMDWHHGRRW